MKLYSAAIRCGFVSQIRYTVIVELLIVSCYLTFLVSEKCKYNKNSFVVCHHTAPYNIIHLNISSRIFFPALLWTAPELMASQRAGALGLSTGTQKGDVYSFAIILHEILYRAGLFRCVDNCKPILSKSKFS